MKSLFRSWKVWFALACAVAAALPFLSTAKSRKDVFFFETTLSSSVQGIAQLFFDIGRNFNEEDSANKWLDAGSQNLPVRFGLPPATYRSFRFDPNIRESVMTMTNPRIVDKYGKVIKQFAATQLKPVNQIAGTKPTPDGMEIQMTPGANDPNFILTLDQPLVLDFGIKYWIRLPAAVFAGTFLAVFGLLMLPYSRWQNGALGRVAPWCRQNPLKTILLTAVASVALQCHPLIFFGKSLVSPNNAVYLLYDTFPTLPGYKETELEDAKGADVGAMMWAHLCFPMIQHDAIFGSGELPLWNRYNLNGVPSLGQGQSMFGDPLNFLTILTRGAAWSWDARFVIVRMLFAFGTGLIVWMLVRHLGATLLITASMAYIGYFAFRFNHAAIFSVCWGPWILVSWCWLSAATTAKQRNLSLLAMVVSHITMMSSGTIKEAAMTTACLDLAGFLLILLDQTSWRNRAAKLAGAVFAGLVFALVFAPGWMTFFNALGKSRTNYDVPFATQQFPWRLIGFFEDLFYREFRPNEGQIDPSVNFLILAGVLWALAIARENFSNRKFIAVGLAALLPVGMVFGIIPSAVIIRLPFIANIIHIDNTFSCPLIVLSAVLAGFGLASAARQLAKAEWLSSYFVFVGLLAVLASVYFGSDQNVPTSPFFHGYIAALFLVVIIAPIAVRCALREAQPGALGVVLAATLGLLLWRHGQYLSTPFDAYVVNPKVRVKLNPTSPAIEFINHHLTEPARTVGLGYTLFPGYNQVLDWETIYGVDAIRNKYVDELAELTPIKKITDWGGSPATQEDIGAALPMQDLMNVRYYLTAHQDTPRVLAGRKPLASLDLDISESPTAWPRAFLTTSLRSYREPKDFVQMVMQSNGQPFASVQEGDRARLPDGAGALPSSTGNGPIRPASDYKLTSNTTSFTIAAERPGIVVLSETYYPGDFRVTVNDAPTRYFRVNHAFKGIYLSHPGTYRISFRYWPEKLTLSLWLFAAGLVLAAGAWVLDSWLRRTTARAA